MGASVGLVGEVVGFMVGVPTGAILGVSVLRKGFMVGFKVVGEKVGVTLGDVVGAFLKSEYRITNPPPSVRVKLLPINISFTPSPFTSLSPLTNTPPPIRRVTLPSSS